MTAKSVFFFPPFFCFLVPGPLLYVIFSDIVYMSSIFVNFLHISVRYAFYSPSIQG